MTIRFKLMLLVIIVSGANLVSFFAQSMIARHVEAIEAEQGLLQELGDALITFAYEVNRVDSEDFHQQVQKTQLSRASLDEAFDRIAAAEILPGLNDTVQSSLDTLPRFRQAIETGYTSFLSAARSVTSVAAEVLGENVSFTTPELHGRNVERVGEVIATMYSATHILDVTTNSAIQNLTSQSDLVAQEISRLDTFVSQIVLAVIAAIFIGSFSVGLVITNRIGSRIQAIETGIQRMKDGDLADRIAITSGDELGRLSNDVNVFTESLGQSMSRIKVASNRNLSIKTQLVESVAMLTRMVETVDTGAASINTDMDQLGAAVHSTSDTVETVERQVQRLKSVLNEQVAMIEESTASVTQMITAIGSVGAITQKKAESMDDLGSTVADGLSKMKTTTEIIRKIHNSIDEIHGAVTIIRDMSDRTNLLAMNAAIEAAHAGESGKGFAVVAGEIRKLAEASATNSQRIDNVLSAIVGNIEHAADSGETTRNVFHKIDREVQEAVSAFEEIAGSTAEVETGGKQILEAMSHLNKVSSEVTDSSHEMADAVTSNREATDQVTLLSEKVLQRVQSILDSTNEMNQALEDVTNVTNRIDSISETIEVEVSVFKTGVNELATSPEGSFDSSVV